MNIYRMRFRRVLWNCFKPVDGVDVLNAGDFVVLLHEPINNIGTTGGDVGFIVMSSSGHVGILYLHAGLLDVSQFVEVTPE